MYFQIVPVDPIVGRGHLITEGGGVTVQDVRIVAEARTGLLCPTEGDMLETE